MKNKRSREKDSSEDYCGFKIEDWWIGELNLKEELPLLEDDLVLSLRQLGFERRRLKQ